MVFSSFAAVILELQREATVVSCLRSACRLLQRSYHQLEDSSEPGGGTRQGSDSEITEENNSMEFEYPHSKSDECDGDGRHSMAASPAFGEDEVTKTACGQSAMQEEASLQLAPVTADSQMKVQSDGGGLPVTQVASQALQFIGPFVEEIQQLYRSPTVSYLSEDCRTPIQFSLSYKYCASSLVPRLSQLMDVWNGIFCDMNMAQ